MCAPLTVKFIRCGCRHQSRRSLIASRSSSSPTAACSTSIDTCRHWLAQRGSELARAYRVPIVLGNADVAHASARRPRVHGATARRCGIHCELTSVTSSRNLGSWERSGRKSSIAASLIPKSPDRCLMTSPRCASDRAFWSIVFRRGLHWFLAAVDCGGGHRADRDVCAVWQTGQDERNGRLAHLAREKAGAPRMLAHRI
jgi:hypothetical protein